MCTVTGNELCVYYFQSKKKRIIKIFELFQLTKTQTFDVQESTRKSDANVTLGPKRAAH
jgi:hypothetical protein